MLSVTGIAAAEAYDRQYRTWAERRARAPSISIGA